MLHQCHFLYSKDWHAEEPVAELPLLDLIATLPQNLDKSLGLRKPKDDSEDENKGWEPVIDGRSNPDARITP